VEVTGTTPNGKSSSRLSANTLGTGNAGNLTINTRALIVRDSQVSASTLGEGNAGNLTVKAAESIELSGVFFGDTDDYPAGLFAQVNSEGTGRGGKLTVETGRLSISNGAKVQVATFGTGDAGDLFILASDIDIFETPRSKYTYFAGGIYAGVQTTRDAIKPPKGYGGSVTIETNRLRVRDGGTVTTTTEGLGDAGSLRIRATESVEVFGISPDGQFSSEISAATTPQSIGFGGSMSIDTGKLTIADRGMVTVQNRNNGQAGNLKINARSVNLDKGTISATTLSGNGGNIILDIGDILLLRNNSQISTTAGTAQQGGDGGNIDIQSKYIIAIPEEDSDITANAFEGRGGNIHINSQGIFGIESRSQRTERSDITASSELGVAGEIALIAPDNSTIVNSLSELPQNPIDTNALIANSCIARTQKQEGTFTITGSGGLPYRPGDTSISLYSTGDVRGVLPNTSTSWKQGDPIVEPTGVYRLNNGKLVMSRECS
jgi:large exoprotein involved in heme utilization and adhesion